MDLSGRLPEPMIEGVEPEEVQLHAEPMVRQEPDG